MAKKIEITKLANLLFEVGTLRKVPRAHMQTLLTHDLTDNIASHSFRVAIIGWFLAQMENVDPNKVSVMCLFHDTAEARSGDQNWVHKKYVKVFEEEIVKDQLNNLPFAQNLSKLNSEYQTRKTKESIVAKDADLIDQMLLLKEYEWVGNNEANNWLGENKGKGNMQYKLLKTASAKKLAQEILKQKPSDWWREDWTSNRR